MGAVNTGWPSSGWTAGRLHAFLRCLLIVACALPAAQVARASQAGQVDERAQSDRFASAAEHPRWQALLDVGGATVARGQFYFSSAGPSDPVAELVATRDAILAEATIACRFPARARFLREEGLLIPAHVACPGWDAFSAKHAGANFTVVLAEGFMANLGSVFGHTFMRIDDAPTPGEPGKQAEHTTTSVLTAETVNFRADTRGTTGKKTAPAPHPKPPHNKANHANDGQ